MRQPKRHRADRLRFGKHEAAPTGLIGLSDRGSRLRRIDRGHIREMSGNPVQSRFGIEIADDHQDGPVRPVMCLVKRLQFVRSRMRKVFGPAQDRVAVRMTKISDCKMRLVETPVGRIQLAGSFLEDDAPLDLDLGRVESGPAHPVGLEYKAQFPSLLRKCEPVVGTILRSLGVRLPAGQQNEPVDLPLGKALSSLEEHMLDKVGQPRAPGGSSNDPTG